MAKPLQIGKEYHPKPNILMGEKQWLSIHLYYNQPWTDFLLKRVIPFVRPTLDTGMVDQFFYVRYWHRGPHIRLRFFGLKEHLNEILLPNLTNYFEDYFEYNPSFRSDPEYPDGFPEKEKWLPNNSVQVMEYKPEFHRYGGPEGVTIAERQFSSSSSAVLQKFADKGSAWDYDTALGTGILFHISMAHAMRMDKTEAVQFFNMCAQSWMPRVVASKRHEYKGESLESVRNKIAIDFQRSFRSQKDQIVPFIDTLWAALDEGQEFEESYMNEYYKEQTEVCRSLIHLQSGAALKARPQTMNYDVLEFEGAYTEAKIERWMHMADYVHMTNNRLGILNRDESYLAFLLTESLQRSL